MTARCPGCGAALGGIDLDERGPALPLCPRCRSPLDIGSATKPPQDAAALRTLERRSSSGGSLAEGKSYALVILSGKEPGKVIPLRKARVTIGRTHCDVNLDDGQVSRQHALLEIHGAAATLEDLGSSNGTFIEDSRVKRAELEDRSEFRIGNHQLLFLASEPDPDPA